ncbi:hypothetical protein MA16_Dca010125 [Dendrobium catenatum]|uniref:Protein LITTLE ZIPPER 4 n=1 Tax=Dendrobium catenatum TaxID=906689 RepID=A0A2I0X752_9ASPA|nr:hypothetical protein MA16_Dca010125 [Dendrobium catenatum]
MKIVNKILYFENKWIMEENKRLRERALFLSQENKALLAHLQTTKKPSNFSSLL